MTGKIGEPMACEADVRDHQDVSEECQDGLFEMSSQQIHCHFYEYSGEQ
jgi:hypothetical protein